MFKRKNESEWARASRALASQETALDAKDGDEPSQDDAGSGSPRAPGRADSPSSPTPRQDVNVSVGRSTRPSGLARPDGTETLLSERSFFDGTFKTEESIRILGTIQGELESQGRVIIEPAARVTARVIGAEVTVAGQIDGQIACSGRVELTPSARVTGEITAGTLIMQEGAFFEGQLRMASQGRQASTVAVTTRR